jgi:hypothetical protein
MENAEYYDPKRIQLIFVLSFIVPFSVYYLITLVWPAIAHRFQVYLDKSRIIKEISKKQRSDVGDLFHGSDETKNESHEKISFQEYKESKDENQIRRTKAQRFIAPVTYSKDFVLESIVEESDTVQSGSAALCVEKEDQKDEKKLVS